MCTKNNTLRAQPPSPNAQVVPSRPVAATRPNTFAACPIAEAERMARYVCITLRGNTDVARKELRAWRDRDRLPLSDALLDLIAAHVIVHTQTPAEW